jgi:hypothetical protein
MRGVQVVNQQIYIACDKKSNARKDLMGLGVFTTD